MKFLRTNNTTGQVSDKVANTIASGILGSQQKFAVLLQKRTNKWKQKHKWILLYLTCVIIGGLSIISIVKPFHDKGNENFIIPKSISLPTNITVRRETNLITREEYQKVQILKNLYPNLQKLKPGLYDSLLLIEQVYNAQQK